MKRFFLMWFVMFSLSGCDYEGEVFLKTKKDISTATVYSLVSKEMYALGFNNYKYASPESGHFQYIKITNDVWTGNVNNIIVSIVANNEYDGILLRANISSRYGYDLCRFKQAIENVQKRLDSGVYEENIWDCSIETDNK